MTLRQQIIKDIARKIDSWNWPIWEAAAIDKRNYSREEDCLIEQIEINGKLESVKKSPIYWDSDEDIWRQVEEANSKNDSYTDYLYNLSVRAEQRFINDIRKQLRYKMVKP